MPFSRKGRGCRAPSRFPCRGGATLFERGGRNGRPFFPALNPPSDRPEVAIIAVNKVKEMPVVVNGELEIRKMMNLSLSCDHRVVDGWDAASFIQDLKKLLETPLRLLSLR